MPIKQTCSYEKIKIRTIFNLGNSKYDEQNEVSASAGGVAWPQSDWEASSPLDEVLPAGGAGPGVGRGRKLGQGAEGGGSGGGGLDDCWGHCWAGGLPSRERVHHVPLCSALSREPLHLPPSEGSGSVGLGSLEWVHLFELLKPYLKYEQKF